MKSPTLISFNIQYMLFFLYSRYKVGQRFGQHIDESVNLGDGKRTHYTLLIYLSGGLKAKAKNDLSIHNDSSPEPLVGGETVFYGSRNKLVAEVNVFPFPLLLITYFSYKHNHLILSFPFALALCNKVAFSILSICAI